MGNKRSNNKQLTINIVSNIAIYILQFGVSFFLTPFIVRFLGVEAYGFVQLSSQIISYTTLLSVGLNAMSSRFITVEYHRGDFTQANKFFSSVFWGNVFLSTISLITAFGILLYLDRIITIPEHLVLDVKLLFGFLSINAVLGIAGSVFNIATFVKNRLELRSIRTAIGSIINVALLMIVFTLFIPHLWFLGVTGLIGTIYVILVNVHYTRTLTPELHIDIRLFDWGSIKTLLAAGMWSLVIVLSGLFAQGMDLLLTNVFIGATAMGILSLSKSVPVIIQSISTTLSTTFLPTWTQYYAKNEKDKLRNDLIRSISIMGFISCIPVSLYISFGNEFYTLWLQRQDHNMIFSLSVVGLLGYCLAMPIDPLWEIFTVENKIKLASVIQIITNVVVFILVFSGVCFVEDPIVKVFIVAGTRSLIIGIRSLTFLSIVPARIIGIKIIEIYKPLFKTFVATVVIIFFSYIFKLFMTPNTWLNLIIAVLSMGSVGILTTAYIILNNSQRQTVFSAIKSRIFHK